MPQILMPYTVHLDHTLRVTPLSTLFAKGDSAAHRFELTIMRAGVQEDLTGCTVMCKFYRMADSAVVSVPGSVEDRKAVAVLKKSCYDYIGRFALTISIQKGEEETTVFYGDGYMHGQRADTSISGEYIIYDVNTLLEKIAEIDEATAAANTATQSANTATGKANTAATNANNAASAANTAASGASGWANATMTATALETGSAPTVNVTTASDGHKVITVGIPRGNTGATPQISVEVSTGAAGSEASVSVSGTAENPVIHLTIPRGNTGAIENLTINGKQADNGTITLNASDVGALASDGIAADSSKLGGKTWAERLLDIYPIGSIYMSVNSTSPASLFGGTWEQLNDRFLLGAGDSYAAGSTGGEAKHTLTISEIPSHTHRIKEANSSGESTGYRFSASSGPYSTANYLENSGGSESHNNMPPYLAVYMWKRVS